MTTDSAPSRPVLRYHGGKWSIAEWIISHFPPHRIYVEPFGGGGSVLLRKPPAKSEFYNDLDGAIVTLFRVLRDPEKSRELVRRVDLTPYARDEFRAAWDLGEAADDIDLAWRVIVRSWFAHGTCGASRRWKTGFRFSINHSNSVAREWQTYPDALRAVVARLQGVYIDNRAAVDVITACDTAETLFYLDPPYLTDVRGRWDVGAYRHEMRDDDHRALARVVRAIEGHAIVSGYASALYDELYAGWSTRRRRTTAYNGAIREECIWLHPRTAEAVELPLLRGLA